MIAYHHQINFDPELKNKETVEGLFVDVITVRESSYPNLHEKLVYELTFFNNQGRDLSLYSNREFTRTVEGQIWAFEVKEVVTFFWHSSTLTIKYIPHKNFTQELLKYWCLHIILPVFFTIEETYDFLHAGAVEVEGNPLLFIAESFGGKSTMTDYFIKQGHAMISDDKVATYERDGEYFAVHSYPYHRPYRKIEDLGFFVKKFSITPKPIQVMYKLEKAEENSGVAISELRGVNKFTSLRYVSEINFEFQKLKRFEYLMQMTNIVPVYKVKIPWKIDRLNEVYQAMVNHSQSINRLVW